MDYQSFQCLKTLVAHETDARALAISPDGKLFISGGWDKTIKFWQLPTGELLQTWQPHRSRILALAITPDGQTLASSSSDKTVKLYDFGTGQVLHTIEAYSETSPLIPSVAFSQDGKTLYTGTRGGRGRSWDVETGEDLRLSGMRSSGWCHLAIGGAGGILAGSYLNILEISELPRGIRIHELRPDDVEVISALAVSPDEGTIFTGHQNGDIYLWSVRSGERLANLQGHKDGKNLKALAVSPNGQILASGGEDQIVNLWDLRTQRLLCTLEGHAEDVLTLAFSPDGRTLVSGSIDGTIKIWGEKSQAVRRSVTEQQGQGNVDRTFDDHVGSVGNPGELSTATEQAGDAQPQSSSPAAAAGQSFQEQLGNDGLLEMVYVPAGQFLMGSPESEEDRQRDEGPQHMVNVPAFYLGKYLVTQAQWRAVATLPQIEWELKPAPSHFQGDDHPVEQVTWDDAVEFCQRLSRYTGKQYRLPSEAQWEYACRAGTTTRFSFGDQLTQAQANFFGTVRGTTPVGQYPPNAFGLCDMHGNVWEWCEDVWHRNYEGAPTDGSSWTQGISNGRPLRGGSWKHLPEHCRSAAREFDLRKIGCLIYGFRVCCVPPFA